MPSSPQSMVVCECSSYSWYYKANYIKPVIKPVKVAHKVTEDIGLAYKQTHWHPFPLVVLFSSLKIMVQADGLS